MSSEDRTAKNEVFKSATPESPVKSPPRLATSQREAFAKKFGIEIPSELVPLPSNGLVYPEDSSLYGKKNVEIYGMTVHEEDILTSPALLKKGTVISELIRSTLVDKSVDPDELLVGDRNAIMVAVRITGYGPRYEAKVYCDECDTETVRVFDLAALQVNRLVLNPVNPGQNLFSFTLPHTKLPVLFKFMTGIDEQERTVTQERMKKAGLSVDNGVTATLMQTVCQVGKFSDKADVAEFVRGMPAPDSLALRSFIRENEPGIVMKQNVACTQCGNEEEVGIPFGTNFLWPTTTR